MLDDELKDEIAKTLPEGIPHVFISAVTGQGLTQLKDLLWAEITDESNQLQLSNITHRPLDGHHRVSEEDAFIFEPSAPEPDDEDFGADDYDPELDDFEDFDDDIYK